MNLFIMHLQVYRAEAPEVFLRSIIDSIDKPVRLGGILERAALDTLRRTGHQQRPVILSLGVLVDNCLLSSCLVVRHISSFLQALKGFACGELSKQ